MATLIDTHSHIDLPQFENVDEIIDKSIKYGVEKIIIPSVDRNSFEPLIKLCEKYENLYCAVGIHPSEALKITSEDYEEMKRLCNCPKVVAIGECGLDYYWDKTFVEEQKIAFKKQIEIAVELEKALIVHDREAHKDCFDMLQDVKNVPVIMHCFSGSLEFAKKCVKQGFYIALGGVVTFKNAKKMREVAKEVPLDKLLLETDAPYLTPEPFRGKRNEPAYVKFVAEKIAEIRGVSFDEIAEATTDNARKVFGI